MWLDGWIIETDPSGASCWLFTFHEDTAWVALRPDSYQSELYNILGQWIDTRPEWWCDGWWWLLSSLFAVDGLVYGSPMDELAYVYGKLSSDKVMWTKQYDFTWFMESHTFHSHWSLSLSVHPSILCSLTNWAPPVMECKCNQFRMFSGRRNPANRTVFSVCCHARDGVVGKLEKGQYIVETPKFYVASSRYVLV